MEEKEQMAKIVFHREYLVPVEEGGDVDDSIASNKLLDDIQGVLEKHGKEDAVLEICNLFTVTVPRPLRGNKGWVICLEEDE